VYCFNLEFKRINIALNIKLKQYISEIAKLKNPYSKTNLQSASKAITKLNDFIEERIPLSDDEIKSNLDVLLINDIDMNAKHEKGINIIRARSNKEEITKEPCFNNIEELSYRRKALGSSRGRCNLENESVFYGCIDMNDIEECKRVAYSEINITKGKKAYLLMSQTTDTLILKYIGIFSHLIRNAKPYFMSDKTWNDMKLVYQHILDEFNDDLFRERYLCDTFFSDIMRRKDSGNLYKVTSILAHMYWESGVIDGIFYTSVKVEGEPVIVLTINAVDTKIKHISTEVYEIVKDYGYAVYNTKKLYTGSIETSGKIDWKKEDE